MAFPKFKIVDDDGNVADVEVGGLPPLNNALKVHLQDAEAQVTSGGTVSNKMIMVGGGTIGGTVRHLITDDTGMLRVKLETNETLVCLGDDTYTEGSEDAMPMAAVRNDGGGTLVGTNNEFAPLQVNADGALYTDGSNATQPVSGTVTANLSSTDNAVLDNLLTVSMASDAVLDEIKLDTEEIEGAVETIEGAIDGSEMQVDVVASLPAGSNSIGTVTSVHGITGGADGKKIVSIAGAHVVLGGDVDCKKVDIQAQTDNTGLIAVGFTGVDATEADGTGVILYAGDTYSLEISNLDLIYIDATVGGDGVRYTYYT